MKIETAKPPKKKKNIKWLVIAGVSLISVVILAYLFIYLPWKRNIEEGNDLLFQAVDYIESSDYFEAVELLKQIEEIDPGNDQSYSLLAGIYLLKNRKENAIEILQVGINNGRDKDYLYEMIGEIYLDDSNYSRAIHFLEKSIGSNTYNHSARYLLAHAYVGTGDLDKAKSTLETMSDSDDESIEYELFVKASALKAMLSKGEISTAEAYIDDLDLSDVSDDVADKVEMLKEVFDDIGKLDDEIKTDIYVSVMISRAALYSEYPDLVIGFLSDDVDEYELYWELNLYLGHAYLMKGNYEKALEYLSQAYLLESNSVIGSRFLARAYFSEDDSSEMIKYYEKAINLSGGDERLEIRMEFFEVLVLKEQYARAEEQLDYMLINDDVDIDELLLIWGSCLLDRELYSQLEDIIDSVPINNLDDDLKGEYYYLSSGISYGAGDWSDSEEFVNKAIETDDYMAKYHLLYGKILYQTSDDSNAFVELERSVELDLEGEVSAEAQKILDRI